MFSMLVTPSDYAHYLRRFDEKDRIVSCKWLYTRRTQPMNCLKLLKQGLKSYDKS